MVHNIFNNDFTKIQIHPSINHELNNRRKINSQLENPKERVIDFPNLNQNSLIVDVRTEYEFLNFKSQYYQNSINIPIKSLLRYNNLDFLQSKAADNNILFFCNNKSRSKLATQLLKEYGIKSSSIE